MAKMAMIENYLYVICEGHSLGIVNAVNPPHPSLVSTQQAGFDLETIYPFGDKLFLGSAEGVYIYGVKNPVLPQAEGKFEHGQACDPVITDGTYAYITLHAGSYCGGASNELDVVDVSHLPQTSLMKTYPMTRPEELSKDGNLLFVCDGSAGVKVYNAAKADNLQLLTQIPGVDGYDVVASHNLLLLVTDQGLYQYGLQRYQSYPVTGVFFGVKMIVLFDYPKTCESLKMRPFLLTGTASLKNICWSQLLSDIIYRKSCRIRPTEKHHS